MNAVKQIHTAKLNQLHSFSSSSDQGPCPCTVPSGEAQDASRILEQEPNPANTPATNSSVIVTSKTLYVSFASPHQKPLSPSPPQCIDKTDPANLAINQVPHTIPPINRENRMGKHGEVYRGYVISTYTHTRRRERGKNVHFMTAFSEPSTVEAPSISVSLVRGAKLRIRCPPPSPASSLQESLP
jgi:hypothetical protein